MICEEVFYYIVNRGFCVLVLGVGCFVVVWVMAEVFHAFILCSAMLQ